MKRKLNHIVLLRVFLFILLSIVLFAYSPLGEEMTDNGKFSQQKGSKGTATVFDFGNPIEPVTGILQQHEVVILILSAKKYGKNYYVNTGVPISHCSATSGLQILGVPNFRMLEKQLSIIDWQNTYCQLRI